MWVWGEKRRDRKSTGEKTGGFKALERPLKISARLCECCSLEEEKLFVPGVEFFGEGRERIEGVFRPVREGDRVLGREQRDPGRKVPRPSVGICLNSWGNPPIRPPLPVFLRGQGRECVCVLMWVCVCAGGREYCIVMVCWGAGWAQNEGEGAE